MKVNYAAKLEALTATLGERRPRVLLHSCCAPCSSAVLETLTAHFEVTVFFYNPNIFPREEYEKRLYYQRLLLEKMPCCANVELILGPYEEARFLDAARGMEREPEGGARCSACFALRLGETARLAKEKAFDYFCSTLTVSPHKNAEMINGIGSALASECGVPWLPSDFKKREGYKRSIELSRIYGLYRQDFCGCLFSVSPSQVPDAIN